MEDKIRVFRFDFLVEKLSPVSCKCAAPGVVFRFLDFPPVLVEPVTEPRREMDEHEPSQTVVHVAPDTIWRGSRDVQRCTVKGGFTRFKKGKSCYFEMTHRELVSCVKSSPVQVTLVDLLAEGIDGNPKVLGRAALDLPRSIVDGATDLLPQKGRNSTFHKNVVRITGASGKLVASVSVKHRLVSVQDAGVKVNGVLCGQREARAVAEDLSAIGNNPEALSAAVRAHSQDGLEPATQEVSTSTVEQVISTEAESGLHQQSDGKVQRDSSTSLESQSIASCSSEVEDDTHPKQTPLYIPNSMCPPPLFYHCPSSPTSLPHTHAKKAAVEFPEQPRSFHPFHNAQLDEASGAWCLSAQHWTVLMDHDQRNHPMAEVTAKMSDKRAQGKTDHTYKHTPSPPQVSNSTGLPLLTALLEELVRLKSHVDSAQSEPRGTTTMASKCLQTDFSPQSSESPEEAPKASPTLQPHPPRSTTSHCHKHLPHHHHRGKGILRECCMLQPSDRPRVPKGRSVIYAADITHKHRKRRMPNGPKSKRGQSVEKTQRTNVSSTPLALKRKGSNAYEEYHISRKSSQSPKQEHVPASKASVPAHRKCSTQFATDTPGPSSFSTVRKLEVFIPQVIPEAPASLLSSGSRSSVESQNTQSKAMQRSEVVDQDQLRVGACSRTGRQDSPSSVQDRPSRTGTVQDRPYRTGVQDRLSRTGVQDRPYRTGVQDRPHRTGVQDRPYRSSLQDRPFTTGMQDGPFRTNKQDRSSRPNTRDITSRSAIQDKLSSSSETQDSPRPSSSGMKDEPSNSVTPERPPSKSDTSDKSRSSRLDSQDVQSVSHVSLLGSVEQELDVSEHSISSSGSFPSPVLHSQSRPDSTSSEDKPVTAHPLLDALHELDSPLPTTPRDGGIVMPGASTPPIPVPGRSRHYTSPAPGSIHARGQPLLSRRVSIDLGSPMAMTRKHGSLLNVVGSQTIDSFMSMDSLDIATSSVLPKGQRVGGVVYLATSQSSFGGSERNLGPDTSTGGLLLGEPPNMDGGTVSVSEEEDEYSLQYSDDFEETTSESNSGDSP